MTHSAYRGSSEVVDIAAEERAIRRNTTLHPTGARLEPGEVLVCRGSDPAWTPLFLRVGALVMETGGAVSHGSIPAREYGLPAVAGVNDATTRRTDGQAVSSRRSPT